TAVPSATFAPNPAIVRTKPEYYMVMGLTAEEVAGRWKVSRAEQDEFALRSHLRAAEAVDSGRFDPGIVPLDVTGDWIDDAGQPRHADRRFIRDEGPRRDTSAE